MRASVLSVVLLGLALARPALAQDCPPSDPLCTAKNRAGKSPASPAPAPVAQLPAPKEAEDRRKDDKQEKLAQRGVITLAEVTITGRIQKPIAAVDVSRIQPKLTLGELRQAFLERIEAAIYKDPF